MRTLLVTLALTVAACGGGDRAAAPPADVPTTVRCPSFATECEEALPAGTVELRGIQFRPDELEVAVGTTVTFENLDPVRHTVVGGRPGEPDPTLLDLILDHAGDQAQVTFDTPGEYRYYCDVHPGAMQAVVVVR